MCLFFINTVRAIPKLNCKAILLVSAHSVDLDVIKDIVPICFSINEYIASVITMRE